MNQQLESSERVLVQFSQNHMATTFHLTLSILPNEQSRAKQVLTECHQKLSQLESELSEYIESSPVFQLNQSCVGEKIEASLDLVELYEHSCRIQKATQNKFNAFFRSESNQREELFRLEDRFLIKQVPGARIGFGAIGKGYALDQLRSLVEANGFGNYVLNAGGSSLILAGFENNESVPWEFSWAWKRDEKNGLWGADLIHSTGTNIAIGISGSLEQGPHIKNTNSKSWETSFESCMVAHPSAMEADALSTAVFVGGWENSTDWDKHMMTPPAIATIDRKLNQKHNRMFEKFWGNPFLLMLLGANTAIGDEEIDLGALFGETINPYLLEREIWWIALPIFMIVILIWHLRQESAYTILEEENDNEID